MVLPASEQMHMQWRDINIQERKLKNVLWTSQTLNSVTVIMQKGY